MRSSTEATRLAQLPYRDSGLVQYMFCDAGLFYRRPPECAAPSDAAGIRKPSHERTIPWVSRRTGSRSQTPLTAMRHFG
jgi:hypothetical protein